uniref:Truncated NADH-plastoquinone oxidoreductase subunit 5 n=1 Tax=Gentiana lawrencei var. farreri TaxID=156521 RepID=A0A1C9IIH7_9GENT|nr:truncated NADH-plastoquinone oxidoreductase subunit 5 [Gentiana lawrencei var. farreri]
MGGLDLIIPLPVPIFLRLGLLFFPTTTIRLRRMWSFRSVLLLSIILVFSTNLSIQQINSNSIYHYVWSWLITNDFSLELGYLLDPLTSIMSILITTVRIAVLEVNPLFLTLCAVLLFAGSIAKSAQFPLHV